MEKLVGNELGPGESWSEYAEHSLTHDDLPNVVPVAVVLDEAPDHMGNVLSCPDPV